MIFFLITNYLLILKNIENIYKQNFKHIVQCLRNSIFYINIFINLRDSSAYQKSLFMAFKVIFTLSSSTIGSLRCVCGRDSFSKNLTKASDND